MILMKGLLLLLSFALVGSSLRIPELREDSLENEVREFYEKNIKEMQDGMAGVPPAPRNCTPLYPNVKIVAHRGANFSPRVFAPVRFFFFLSEQKKRNGNGKGKGKRRQENEE